MKRSLALGAIKSAGYHNDSATFTRVYCEHRISYKVAIEEFRKGQAAKDAGARCDCYDCKKTG